MVLRFLAYVIRKTMYYKKKIGYPVEDVDIGEETKLSFKCVV